MTTRNLLPKRKLADFIRWLDAEGIPHRVGIGRFQVLQVKPHPEREVWGGLYVREEVPDHLVVTADLIHTVACFNASLRKERKHVGL